MKNSLRISAFTLNFILFNFCFFCIQLVFIYSKSESFTSLIPLPWGVYGELLATLCIQLSLYLLLAFFQTFLLIGILKRSWHYFSADQWQLIIWGLSITAILSANTYYFPLSMFSKLFIPPLSEEFFAVILIISLFGLGLLLFNSLLHRTNWPLIIVVIPLLLFINHKELPIKDLSNKPNIILLGIDSLSPGRVKKETMPFLSRLVQNSTQFTQTISPLARTYPAWCSILTGLYAKHHHAKENLIAKSKVNSKASIVWLLNHQGYNTLFATDDRRFNSIDTDFGFKKIIGPKLGVNDVILGSFNDFPLGNLLINIRLGSWLFPYNYSNRASFFSYYPETFNRLLKLQLAKEPRSKPLFLAVHFTLPHWPYAWAESLPNQVNNEFSLEKRESLYQDALQEVDQQLQTFYRYLKNNNYLNNSLVIVLSDHGEALYYANSRQTNSQNYQGTQPSLLAEYLKNNTATVLDKSAGHGSDILSPQQYHSLLALNIYKNGKKLNPNTKINTRVALIDIAPTIVSFLKLPIPSNTDGISLLGSALNPKNIALPNRAFYVESGMFPNQDISKEKAMQIGKDFYTVNPDSNELEITSKGLWMIASQKLYGIIEGEWILALYPDKTHYIPVIQNLRTGQWTDDLHGQFSEATPALLLKQELQSFFEKSIHFVLPQKNHANELIQSQH